MNENKYNSINQVDKIKKPKKISIAYLLLINLGLFLGAHKFYLKQNVQGFLYISLFVLIIIGFNIELEVLQVLSAVLLMIWWIWWIWDLCTLWRSVKRYNNKHDLHPKEKIKTPSKPKKIKKIKEIKTPSNLNLEKEPEYFAKKSLIKNDTRFQVKVKVLTGSNFCMIIVAENGYIAIKENFYVPFKIFYVTDIRTLNFELDDGVANSFGRGIIGGALFGTTGAILGSLNTKDVINKLSIVFTFDNFDMPRLEVKIINSKTKKGMLTNSTIEETKSMLSLLEFLHEKFENVRKP